MPQRIGFAGVGLMGHGMARNIMEKGYPLRVLGNRNRAPVEDLVRRGAAEAAGPGDLARHADVVILCLPSSSEVEAFVFGEDGLLSGAQPGLIVIDTTTAEPASTAKVAAALAAAGVRMADAPLQRTPIQAEQGRLNTLVGADPELFAEIRPVLETFCEKILHIGPLGSGHTIKLINNFLTMGTAALVAEAATVAARAGVDLHSLAEVVSSGGANSSVFQRMFPWVLGTGEGEMLFRLDGARKDVRCYTHLAESVGATHFLGETVHQLFTLAVNTGHGDAYVPAIARAIGAVNGVALGPKSGEGPGQAPAAGRDRCSSQ